MRRDDGQPPITHSVSYLQMKTTAPTTPPIIGALLFPLSESPSAPAVGTSTVVSLLSVFVVLRVLSRSSVGVGVLLVVVVGSKLK